MPDRREPQRDSWRDLVCDVEWDGNELLDNGPRIGLGVERKCRMVPAEADPVGIGGFLFLEVPAVRQDDAGEVPGSRRGEDRPGEPGQPEAGEPSEWSR